jgi:hypothetical protein
MADLPLDMFARFNIWLYYARHRRPQGKIFGGAVPRIMTRFTAAAGRSCRQPHRIRCTVVEGHRCP